MTSRRCTLVEEGARELLQLNGYSVWIVPVHFNKRFPPAHLVAQRPTGEKRFIRIRKKSRKAPTIESVTRTFWRDIVLFRKHLASHPEETGLRCECWVYTLEYGFRCFEVRADHIREIPKLLSHSTAASRAGGAA